MNRLPISDLQQMARQVGIDLAGSVEAGATPFMDAYLAWVAAGLAGDMSYLSRSDAVESRKDPRNLMPATKSVVAAAVTYGKTATDSLTQSHGRVARYAWGDDYHVTVKRRLQSLVDLIGAALHRMPNAKICVDTSPVLERVWAQQAGLGFVGNNSCLIHPDLGSFTYLGIILLDIEVERSPEVSLPGCGTCTQCMQACPTRAIIAPRVVDARRCISYLTIENRADIPVEYRSNIGEWVFGCDICQQTCPWNSRRLHTIERQPTGDVTTLYLPDLLTMSPDQYRERFRRSAIWRATLNGLARNAAVVLGNQGGPEAFEIVTQASVTHESEMVQSHARWAAQHIQRKKTQGQRVS